MAEKESGGNEIMKSEVMAAALELFEGDRQMAESWLSKPLLAIGSKIPMEYIDSPERAYSTTVHG